jgi:prepilin-type processing-associated H-X9-DG protein
LYCITRLFTASFAGITKGSLNADYYHFANQPTSPSQATNKLINFAKPSRTVAIGDCSLNASTAYKISSDSDIATPHKGGCNMTFLDGHGEFFKSPPAYTNGIFKKTGGE